MNLRILIIPYGIYIYEVNIALVYVNIFLSKRRTAMLHAHNGCWMVNDRSVRSYNHSAVFF